MEYRREIDGLRAVAVLPVILFHAGFSVFAGGFVGVDVFFVISGYLITTIILGEMNNGKFSIVTFYERRARRILPPLFFVIFCCLPFAWLWLSPDDLNYFCKSLMAVSAFSSNILFWLNSGYFDTTAEFIPLLHTWSLAVEEQFYILFPPFLMLVWKLRKRLIFCSLLFIAIVSLACAQYGAYHYPSATFFLLHTRGWELAIGSLIAFYFLYKQEQAELIRSHKKVSETLGLLGLFLICYSIFAFDKTIPFPSIYALIPTIGTALIIIFATTDTTAGRFLGTKPMVGIGLISYSIYLWHQPLFAFARHRSLLEPSMGLLLLLSFLSISLGYISWLYIEKPFRNKMAIDKGKIFGFAVAGSVFLTIIGLIGNLNKGCKNRFDNTYAKLAVIKDDARVVACKEEIELSTGHTCIIGDKSKKPSIALLGDSHSARLTSYLDEILNNKGKSLIVYSQIWGVPLLDVGTDTVIEKSRNNRTFILNAYNSILSNSDIDTVILAAEWANYTEGRRYLDTETAYYTDKMSRVISMDENLKVFERGLKRTLDLLDSRRIKIIVVGSVPEYDWNVPQFLGKSYRFTGSTTIPKEFLITLEKYEKRNANVLKAFKNVDIYSRSRYVDPFSLLCNGTSCKYMDSDNNVFYVDGNHLTYSGSKAVVDDILKSL
jgi:peptidoglycan/LPS O-acetylase OafA/YrhL